MVEKNSSNFTGFILMLYGDDIDFSSCLRQHRFVHTYCNKTELVLFNNCCDEKYSISTEQRIKTEMREFLLKQQNVSHWNKNRVLVTPTLKINVLNKVRKKPKTTHNQKPNT